jgi:ABC-type branched-subunit amino acid transport system substrate-binding protein
MYALSCRSILSTAAKAGRHLCAIAGLVAIAGLTACTTAQQATTAPPPPPPKAQLPVAKQPAATPGQTGFVSLPGMPAKATPVRVGIILPFSNGSDATRHLAISMMNAAEMALYDSGKRNIVLITGDEGGGDGYEAADAARKLIAQGAEIILGPLFAKSVRAVAPIAAAHNIPVIGFSTDRSVAGNGVYLLSFQPENEVARIVSYAASQGHTNFAGLVPLNPYGDHVAQAFRKDVPDNSGQLADLERFNPQSGDVVDQAAAISAAHPDAVLVGQGGALLRGIAPTLAFDQLDPDNDVQLLGTGVWDDPSTLHEPALVGGWFAAPQPDAADTFMAHYQNNFGTRPPQLTTLSYDAVALVALLSDSGTPFHRFTEKALTDPNGFSGVTGIFRFDKNGACERGLAILAVGQDGFTVVSPAPTTFQHVGS